MQQWNSWEAIHHIPMKKNTHFSWPNANQVLDTFAAARNAATTVGWADPVIISFIAMRASSGVSAPPQASLLQSDLRVTAIVISNYCVLSI
jgi:hypothetical protein